MAQGGSFFLDRSLSEHDAKGREEEKEAGRSVAKGPQGSMRATIRDLEGYYNIGA